MKNTKNWYWMFAGAINFFTALLHTFGGQMDLVNPLLRSNLKDQAKAEWLGVWHMVTILLFASSYIVLRNALLVYHKRQVELMKYIGILYVVLSIPSFISSMTYQLLAPQWILLLPVGVLILFGSEKNVNQYPS